MAALPVELQYKIALYMNVDSLKSACRTDRTYHSICSDPKFWKTKARQDLGVTPNQKSIQSINDYMTAYNLLLKGYQDLNVYALDKLIEKGEDDNVVFDRILAQGQYQPVTSRLRVVLDQNEGRLVNTWRTLVDEDGTDELLVDFLNSYHVTVDKIDELLKGDIVPAVLKWTFDTPDPNRNEWAKVYTSTNDFGWRQYMGGTAMDVYKYEVLRRFMRDDYTYDLYELLDIFVNKLNLKITRGIFNRLTEYTGSAKRERMTSILESAIVDK